MLLTDFCQQYPSHSVGTLAFGPDGMLYLSAGDGAHFDYADYGQIGNVCGDPPNAGGDIGPPDRQGGALRAQAFRRPAASRSRPTARSCASIRTTRGSAVPSVVAYGFRNPFRFTFRPGHERDLDRRRRLDDVGGDQPHRRSTRTVRNYGWPCYEGAGAHAAPTTRSTSRCETLYARARARRAPYFTYNHASQRRRRRRLRARRLVDLRRAASTPATSSRPSTTDALFFARLRAQLHLGHVHGRERPARPGDARRRSPAAPPARCSSTEGPDGALYYADLDGGTIRRIAASTARRPRASRRRRDRGAAPLTVHVRRHGSTDPRARR